MSIGDDLLALQNAASASYEAGMRAERDRADAIEAENQKLRDELVGKRESWYTRALAAEDRATKAEEGLREAAEALRFVQDEGMLGAHSSHWDRTGGSGSGCPACHANRAARERINIALARIKGLLPP